MVNASLHWASIVGIVLVAFGLYLFYLRSAKPSISRDLDPFMGLTAMLCGGILFFQGWRLDPILQFSQFLLAGSNVFLIYILFNKGKGSNHDSLKRVKTPAQKIIK